MNFVVTDEQVIPLKVCSCGRPLYRGEGRVRVLPEFDSQGDREPMAGTYIDCPSPACNSTMFFPLQREPAEGMREAVGPFPSTDTYPRPRAHRNIMLGLLNNFGPRPEKCDACDLKFRAKEPFQTYDRGVRVDYVHLDCVAQYSRDYGMPEPDEHEQGVPA